MVVNHYTGLELDATDVMDMIGTDRYLTTDDLYQVLESFGLEAEWGDGVPRIVLIGGDHWVVYLGDGYYHDPLKGPYQRGKLGSGCYIKTIKNDNLDLLLR